MKRSNNGNTSTSKIHIIRFKRIYSKKLNSSETPKQIRDLLSSQTITSTLTDFFIRNKISVKKIVINDFKLYSFIKFYGTDEDYRKVHNFLCSAPLGKVTIIARSKR